MAPMIFVASGRPGESAMDTKEVLGRFHGPRDTSLSLKDHCSKVESYLQAANMES